MAFGATNFITPASVPALSQAWTKSGLPPFYLVGPGVYLHEAEKGIHLSGV